jgi:hypothetical protein
MTQMRGSGPVREDCMAEFSFEVDLTGGKPFVSIWFRYVSSNKQMKQNTNTEHEVKIIFQYKSIAC